MTYGLSIANGKRITALDIIDQLDSTIPLQNAHIKSIQNLCNNGCKYSYQDYDVLAAAYRAIGKTEISKYDARWVEKMNGA